MMIYVEHVQAPNGILDNGMDGVDGGGWVEVAEKERPVGNGPGSWEWHVYP
jgi:hypothetical protein